MTPERRQKILLWALLALALVAGWQYLGPYLDLGGGGGGLGGWTGDVKGVKTPQGEIVELAALSPEPRTYQVKRDPFRFGELPRPAPPLQSIKPPPQPTKPEPPPKPVETGPVLPAVNLSYKGKFGPKRRPIAVLIEDDNIINAREGDEVNEHFRVRSINLESIDLEYIHFPDQPAQRLAVDS